MEKKEILKVFMENAISLLNKAGDEEEIDLAVLAHANLIAITAIQNGHREHLMACFAAFVEAIGILEDRQVNDAVKDLLNEVGINLS